MAGIKVILTGATGMVGEGVLLACLQNSAVDSVLMVNRRPYPLVHPKVSELIVPDFSALEPYADAVSGFDACFFCAGISSIGKSEAAYTRVTYATTLAFANVLLAQNPAMVFTYVSGSGTDSSEKGRLMWARVKGKTENALERLGFTAVYSFRPGVMVPFPGQKNWKPLYRVLAKAIRFVAPKAVLSMQEVGRAMIHVVTTGYPQSKLEVKDIRKLAEEK